MFYLNNELQNDKVAVDSSARTQNDPLPFVSSLSSYVNRQWVHIENTSSVLHTHTLKLKLRRLPCDITQLSCSDGESRPRLSYRCVALFVSKLPDVPQ